MSTALGPRSLIGRELSHYRIVAKIGQGGMGEVFLAHDEHLGHNVALKVLPFGTNERSRHLFRKEAHALSKLNHPNIVTVLDFDTQETLDFLVMEYVPGQALDERVREGALPEKVVLDIGLQLAEGLAAAHQQGVIHRDLKPGNLRLTNDGRLKILDFGLARSTLSFSSIASTVSVDGPSDCSGTLPYMATEQVLGQAADARTDIYAAGAVLYELCTGWPPFEQKLFTALVDEILHQTPIPPYHYGPGISQRFGAIILKCLEKAPDKRYQSAGELADRLRELRAPDTKPRGIPLATAARYVLLALLTGVVLIAIAWQSWRWMDRTGHDASNIGSLAVLPFANLSGDSQQEYLADGMTDFLITDLGQMHTLQRIISRTSVVRYKTERQPLREIARQLNVDALIEGSVIRSDNVVRVTVRLVSGTDDRQLWSHSFESEFRDLLTLQHELAVAIAREIRSNMTPADRARLASAHAVDPAAQDAYLRAKYLQFGTPEQRAKSRQYFEQTIQLDPDYAPAYAGLADSYWDDIGLPARETMPKARDYALKAISLDEKLAHAHTALATVRFYGDWDWEAADREYQRALELNPNDAEAHRMYSVFLTAMKRFEPALAQVLAAEELDPLSSGNDATAGWDLYCARRYDQAIQHCQKAVELTPNNESAHGCLSYNYLGKVLFPQAVEEAQKARKLSGEQAIWSALLGRAYAKNGNDEAARKILAQILAQSRQSYVPPSSVAVLYATLGNTKMAFQWLDKAYGERDLYLAWIKADPAFDSLRSDARFVGLCQRMKFPME
jgi:serine/threonine protein kinase/Tfp pilus assembly protein PilF